MNDLPYIIGSYALVAVAGVGLAIFTSLRLGRAKARLKAVDKRAETRRESLQ